MEEFFLITIFNRLWCDLNVITSARKRVALPTIFSFLMPHVKPYYFLAAWPGVSQYSG